MSELDFTRDRVIAIVRGVPPQAADDVARALLAGGVRLIEVTLNSERALDTIARWRQSFPELRVGAGTVLSVTSAREVLAAGGQYLISPHTDEALIAYAREQGVPMFPGALTPTEILRAHAAGASAVKVFPVGSVGGPRYLRDVLAPLNHVPLIAVGGVDAQNTRAYLEAGAVALGVGSSLVSPQLIAAGRFDELTERARTLTAQTAPRSPHDPDLSPSA